MGFVKTMDEITECFLGTFEFYDAEMLTIFFESKMETVQRLVPPPLKPHSGSTGMIFVANYPNTNFGVSYLESALFLDVIHNGDEGVYCLAMPVSNDMAMIGGRETFGYPKKIGNISFEKNGDDVKGWTERHGTRFLEASAKLTGKFNDETVQSSIMERLGDNIVFCVYNFKYFPSPDLMGFDYNPRLIKEIVKFNPNTIQIGEAELQFESSTHDPWGDVDIVKVLGAVYSVGDNTMLPGTVAAEVDQTDFIPYELLKVDAM